MATDRHVIGVFDDRAKAQRALESLVEKNFEPSGLSLMVSEDGRGHHFEVDKNKSKTAEGVGYGAVLGGLVGSLGTVAAGVASVTIPGAVLVAGPLGVALASGAAGAAVGGLAGGLIGVGISEDEVSLVESELKDGSIMVAAHSIDAAKASTAKEVFKKAGAVKNH
jgi:hypothetical protein